MPNLPQSPPPDGSAVTDADLAALLAGKRDVAPRLQPVADVLAALGSKPCPRELGGEARALAEFRRRTGVPVRRRHAHRGTAGPAARLSAKVAAGAAAAAVVLAGAAAAAFADVLPAPIQRLAHHTIGAPNAPGSPSAPRHGPPRGQPGAPGQLASHAKARASTSRDSDQHGQYPGPGTSEGQQGSDQGNWQAKSYGWDPRHRRQQGAGGQSQRQPGDGQGQRRQGDSQSQGQHG